MAGIDKIIEDLIAGAQRAGAKIEIQPHEGREEKLASANSALRNAFTAGSDAALARFGIEKKAFGPLLAGIGSMVAGPLARMALGKAAPAMASRVAGPIASTLFDAGAGAVAQRALQPPQPPPQV